MGRDGGGCNVCGPDGAAGRLTSGYALGEGLAAALADAVEVGSVVGSEDGGTVIGSGCGDWVAGTVVCARTFFNSREDCAEGAV